MATKKTPLARVTEEFGDKEKLVDRLLGFLDAGEAGRDALRTRLLAASNAKLLRLFTVLSTVKEKYGSPEGLAQAAANALGRAKDQAYVAKLAKVAKATPARVLDLLRTAEKRAARAA